ncbi:MAG: hypothetical protein ABJ308_00460 [Halieaceae bacterium]
MMIFKHAALQFGIALIAFTLWAAADSWYLLTELAIANALSVLLAALAGVALSTVIHEWGHYAGARLSDSAHTIPEKFGLFVYDFDYEKNSLRQFNIMSLAGQLGSWVTVFGLWWLIPMDNSGRLMLVCAAIGSAIFGGMIEWPVLRRSQHSGEPLKELGKIDKTVLKRSAIGGIGGAMLLWILAS